MPPTLQIIDEPAMTSALDSAIKASLCICFPRDAAVFSHTRAWHGSGPSYSLVLESGGRVIAHLGVVDRILRAGDHPLRVAGVQNVFVLPEHRGQGFADHILRVSMEEAQRRGFDGGLLFCLPVLEKVYARLGWQTLPPCDIRATRASGEHYKLDDKNIAMFYPLKTGTFPAGTIDLQGDDW